MALTQEEIDYYERQRLEHDRRSDIECERDFWTSVMLSAFNERATVAKAVAAADDALECYRERFR